MCENALPDDEKWCPRWPHWRIYERRAALEKHVFGGRLLLLLLHSTVINSNYLQRATCSIGQSEDTANKQ
jgi:hypothetical protein